MECGCFDWQYCRQTDLTCVDCNRCGNGQGASTLCGTFDDAVCTPCQNGTYSALSLKDFAYRCFPCTICEPDRETITACNVKSDTVCGPCPRRMFSWDNGTCLNCSLCPDDPSVIRYTECQLNGAPRNHLCAPGVVIIQCVYACTFLT